MATSNNTNSQLNSITIQLADMSHIQNPSKKSTSATYTHLKTRDPDTKTRKWVKDSITYIEIIDEIWRLSGSHEDYLLQYGIHAIALPGCRVILEKEHFEVFKNYTDLMAPEEIFGDGLTCMYYTIKVDSESPLIGIDENNSDKYYIGELCMAHWEAVKLLLDDADVE